MQTSRQTRNSNQVNACSNAFSEYEQSFNLPTDIQTYIIKDKKKKTS